MATIDIIELRKSEDGSKFYPQTHVDAVKGLHPPKVLNGVYWLYNDVVGIYTPTTIQAGENGNNLFELNSSPTRIVHNFNTKPSVTVMGIVNDELHEVIADVVYVDDNTVEVCWNGSNKMYAYII